MSTETTKSERTYETARGQWLALADAKDALIRAAHAMAEYPEVPQLMALKDASLRLKRLEALNQ